MPRPRALPRPSGALSAARGHGPAAGLVAASALALIAAEFLQVRIVRAGTAVPAGATTTGGAHHGYALALIGAVSLAMALGALRGGSRPAAAALIPLGLASLAVVLAVDLPAVTDEGLIGRTYELAEAGPGAGFWVALAGAAGLTAGGVLLPLRLMREARERSAAAERRRRERRVSRR